MRPRLLVLAQCYPYPPQTGVTNRTFNILRQLQREFDVSLVAFSRTTHQPDPAARTRAWEALSRELHHSEPPVPIPAERSVVRRAWDHLRSLMQGRPFVYHEYHSPEFRRSLARVLAGPPPSAVHLDSLDLYGWLPSLPRVPVACTHHSIESSLLRIQAERVANPLLRAYMAHQADLMESVEREVCPALGLNVMMSALDAQRLQELAPTARTVVAPNGVDLELFSNLDAQARIPGRVVFIGPTFSFPNRDAVEWLLSAIWPRIGQLDPGATLALVGGGPEAALRQYGSHRGVTALGQVPDVRVPLAEASCCVVPIRAGGGTRLKILDAWAAGRAVVSTTIGAEGLETVDGVNILIRDDPAGLAAGVLEVLANPTLRTTLEAGGRATVERTYSWDVIGANLREAYRHLLG